MYIVDYRRNVGCRIFVRTALVRGRWAKLVSAIVAETTAPNMSAGNLLLCLFEFSMLIERLVPIDVLQRLMAEPVDPIHRIYETAPICGIPS